MENQLTPAERRALKARAQLLEPSVRLGREGASDAFYQALQEALERHGLVKIRFTDRKDEKKVLAPEIARQSHSELIMRVGHTAVYHRRREKRPLGMQDEAA